MQSKALALIAMYITGIAHVDAGPTATTQRVNDRTISVDSIHCATVTPRPTIGATQASDIASLISRDAENACSALQNLPQRKIGNSTFEGYALFGGFESGSSLNVSSCHSALNNIAASCLPSAYGGQFYDGTQLFNLTNMLATKNPVLDAATAVGSTTLTVPCSPTFFGSKTTCLPTPDIRIVTFGGTSVVASTSGILRQATSTSHRSSASLLSNAVSGNDGLAGTSNSAFSWSYTDLSMSASQTLAVSQQATPASPLTQSSKSYTVTGSSVTQTLSSSPSKPPASDITSMIVSTDVPNVSGGAGLTIPGFTTIPPVTLASSEIPQASNTNAAGILDGLASKVTGAFAAAAAAALGLSKAIDLADAPLEGLAGDLTGTYMAASGMLEAIEMVDLGAQTEAAAEAIEAIEPSLQTNMVKIKTLLESLAQILKNKLTRKDRYKTWYLLFLAEEATFGILQKAFKGLTGLPIKSGTKALPMTTDPAISISSMALALSETSEINESLSGSGKKNNNKATGTVTSSVPTASSSAIAEYLIVTKEGTPLEKFQAYIDRLPDAGKGYQITSPNVDFQGYVTKLSLTQVQNVLSSDLIDGVTRNDIKLSLFGQRKSRANTRRRASKRFQQKPDEPMIEKRANGYPDGFDVKDCESTLSLLSARIPPLDRQYKYFYRDPLGDGVSIYVMDSGVYQNNAEFSQQQRPFDSFQASYSENPDTPGSPLVPLPPSDGDGHGTCVASMAVGANYGSAPRATLIDVKFLKNGQATAGAVFEGLFFVLKDVRAKNLQKKAVLNMSFGVAPEDALPENVPNPPFQLPKYDIIAAMLTKLWYNDVVTVAAAGNGRDPADGEIDYEYTDLTHPQWNARVDNPLILVGGTDLNGQLWDGGSIENPNPAQAEDVGAGKITVYAQAKDIRCAATHPTGDLVQQKGTSLASPQVAGLAAYFLSLPEGNWASQRTAMQMKQVIMQYAFTRKEGSRYTDPPTSAWPAVAYNKFEQDLCRVAAALPAKRDFVEGTGVLVARQDGAFGSSQLLACSAFSANITSGTQSLSVATSAIATSRGSTVSASRGPHSVNPAVSGTQSSQASSLTKAPNTAGGSLVGSKTLAPNTLASKTSSSHHTVTSASCPDKSFMNSSQLVWKFLQGSNTFNLDYEMTNAHGILTPGTQWMFAQVDGFLSEWTVYGNPQSPKILETNSTNIQFEVGLDQSLTSIKVIGVAKQGLADKSDYWIALYAFGAASAQCGGSLPPLPAAAPVIPTDLPDPTTSTPPPPPAAPTPSNALVIFGVIDAIGDGMGTSVDYWAAVDFDIKPGSGDSTSNTNAACAEIFGQELPQTNDRGHWDDKPASWAFKSALATSLTSCTYTVSATPAASTATGTLQCPGLPTPVACPPVVGAPVGDCEVGNGLQLIPGIPGLEIGGDLDTSEALIYCQW